MDDIDGDDRTLGVAGHRLDRQVVEHPAVNQQSPVGRGYRREHAGNGQHGEDRLVQRAGPVRDERARVQIRADAEESQWELLDPAAAEALPEQAPSPPAAEQRVDGTVKSPLGFWATTQCSNAS